MVNLKIIDRDGNEIQIDELTYIGRGRILTLAKDMIKQINEREA